MIDYYLEEYQHKKDEDEEEKFKKRKFTLYTLYKDHISNLEIAEDIRTFDDLSYLLAPYYKCNPELIYFANHFDIVYSKNMDLRETIFTPIY